MRAFLRWLGWVVLTIFCLLLVHSSFQSRLDSHQSAWQGDNSPSPMELPLEKQRGVSWVGGRQVVTLDDFSGLVDNHVNWIVQTPFGWQDDYDSPQLTLKTEGIYWGETDAGLERTTELAQGLGIQTLLKPHIWLINARDGKWRTDIEMGSEQDWQRWFDHYRTFILHYATFAEAHGIPMLCIGTELQTTAVQREPDWRRLIAEIRQVYHGQLIYAANWYQAFEAIQFWDALDFIGIQAYFPLTGQSQPSLAELKAGWQSPLADIQQVQARYQKPVVFTELGYRSTDDAAIAPWEWPDDSEINPQQLATDTGLQTQKTCYDAFFQTLWHQDWFAGVYIWKWFPQLDSGTTPPGPGFTPQHKPAEQVMGQWYAKG